MNEKQYLTTKEAATLLRTSVKTVRLWCASGQLRAWQPVGSGSQWLIHPSAVRPAGLGEGEGGDHAAPSWD